MQASPRRLLAATLITGAAALAVAPGASAAGVGDATLEWNTVKQTANPAQGSGLPPTRTWLGYVAGTAQQFMGKGDAAPVAPATGTSVANGVADGTPATWAYPVDRAVATNDFDAETRTGTIEFDGNVRFNFTPTGQAPRAVDVQDPVLELAGTTGKLYASGRSGSAADATYDRSQPVFDLDLADASVTTVDQVTTITGIQAKNAVTDRPFLPNYPAGTGGPRPDAEPFFGTFDVTVTEAPVLTVSKTTGILATGEDVVVNGSGFKATPQANPGDTTNAGVYVALVGPTFDTSSRDTPSGTAAFVPQSEIVAGNGSFTRTLNLKSSFGTGANAVDCLQVACRLYTWKAHLDADPSQRVSVPVTFKAADPVVVPPPVVTPVPTVTPTPTATATPTTPTGPTATAAPKVTKAKVVSRRKLTFRASAAGTITATVQRRVARRVKGKRVLRWKTVRRIEKDVRKAGTVSINPKLGRKGQFRVVLRTVSTTGAKGKTVVVKKRFK